MQQEQTEQLYGVIMLGMWLTSYVVKLQPQGPSILLLRVEGACILLLRKHWLYSWSCPSSILIHLSVAAVE